MDARDGEIDRSVDAVRGRLERMRALSCESVEEEGLSRLRLLEQKGEDSETGDFGAG